jgi:hypothetical protein
MSLRKGRIVKEAKAYPGCNSKEEEEEEEEYDPITLITDFL